jgi:hypothetical protein
MVIGGQGNGRSTVRQRLTLPIVAIALLMGTLGFWVGRLSSPTPAPHIQAAASPSPSGGITKARAIDVALRRTGGRSVLFAFLQPIGEVVEHPGGIPRGTLAWVVVLQGSFGPASCDGFTLPGETPQPCPSPNHTAVAFIDYATGRWLMDESPATLPA